MFGPLFDPIGLLLRLPFHFFVEFLWHLRGISARADAHDSLHKLWEEQSIASARSYLIGMHQRLTWRYSRLIKYGRRCV